MNYSDYMKRALLLAKTSYNENEVPVGAVIIKDGIIIGEGRNRRETRKNALLHAEIEAINNACTALSGWRLHGCELIVTLEPCPMCAGAVINSRIDKVVFGAKDIKAGCCESVINMFELPFNHKPEVIGGVMEKECSRLLSDFFAQLRKSR